MKSVIAEYYKLLDSAYEVNGTPRVRSEWNYNNSSQVGVPTLDFYNASDASLVDWSGEKSYFPLESISYSNRPTSGIHYAYLNQYTLDSAYTNNPGVLAKDRYYALNKKGQDYLYTAYVPFTTIVPPPVQGNHPTYKYWISESTASLSRSGNGGYPINYCTVTMPYKQSLQMNKISFTASLGAIPTRMAFSYQKPDLTWVNVLLAGSSVNINPITGQIQFWIQANGTWGRTPYYDTDVSVAMVAIKFSILELDRAGGRAEVIEFSARKELDITSRVVKFDSDQTMAEESFTYPVGTVSSNSGSVQISNYDRALDPGGSLSTVVDRQTTMKFDVVYDTSSLSSVNSKMILRTATMHTTDWQRQGQDDFTLNLFDDAKFLQSMPSADIFEENILLHDLVVQMLDLAGFNNITIQPDLYQNEIRVPWFFTSRDETIWSALQRLCHSTMSALYVDSYGQFQLLGKNQIASDNDTSQLTLRGEFVNGKVPNIISLNKKYTIETNKVDINYNAKRIKTSKQPFNEQPLTDILWQPTETIYLRSQPLQRDMDLTQTYFYVPQGKAELWPYKGSANIDGEAMRWYGKEYSYYTVGYSLQYQVIFSEEERRQLDKISYNYYANSFTGKMMNVQRGSDASGYVTTHKGPSADPYNSAWYHCQRPVGYTANQNNFYGAYNNESALSFRGNITGFTTVQGIDPSTTASTSPTTYAANPGDLVNQAAGLNLNRGNIIQPGSAETTIRTYRPASSYAQSVNSNNLERQEDSATKVSLVGMRFKFLDPPLVNQIGFTISQSVANQTSVITPGNRTSINQSYQINFNEAQSNLAHYGSLYYKGITALQESPNTGVSTSDPSYVIGNARRLGGFVRDIRGNASYSEGLRGLEYNFNRGQWYDVMVQVVGGQGGTENQNCHLAVYVNGSYVGGFFSNMPFLPKSNSWGITSQYASNVVIENAWSWDSTKIGTGPDGTYQENTVYDQKTKSLSSGFLNTGILYPKEGAPDPFRDETSVPGKFMYDDFGSTVHESKDFNVPLIKSPAKGLTGYSDQGQVQFLYLQESADYAQFSVVNAGFSDIIVNGEENFIDGNKVTHVLLIYGYVLEIDPNVSTVTVINKESLKEHLEIKTSITC